MSLPTLSTLNTTQDTNKQLSQIRSYLVQLKDELESELSDVTYDMLSASLQKKIDQINDDIAQAKEASSINAQLITAEYAKVGDLVADAITTANLYADTVSASAITTSNLYADTVSANALSLANANISTLNTNIANAYMANATWLTSGNALIKEGKVENLTSIKATVNTINSNYITANYINATNICSALSSATQGTITVGTGRFGVLKVSDNGDYKQIKFVSGKVGTQSGYFAYHA